MDEYGFQIVYISLLLSFYYTTFYLHTLKTNGGITALDRVHAPLFFPLLIFLGNSFPALMHLVFKSLKHTVSVDTK